MRSDVSIKAVIYVGLVLVSIVLSECTKDEAQTVTSVNKVAEAYPGLEGEHKSFVISGDTLKCELVNGEYIFQGDIILTEDQLNLSKGTGLSGLARRWPDNLVYYEINSNIPKQMHRYIVSAISEYEEYTTLNFVERTTQDNYVEFLNSETVVGILHGTSSDLGMIGGKQRIWLEPSWNTYGEVLHEIGHTIGLFHEHSRADRDSWITVNYNNIKKSDWDQYYISENSFYIDDFDFESIMLYPCYLTSAIDPSAPVITKKSTGIAFQTNSSSLSKSDIKIIRLIYDGSRGTIFNPSLKNGTVTDIDGNVYKTVRIGNQWWMAENLKTTRYRNGDLISTGLNESVWSNTTIGAYSIYENDINNNNIYGKLYNWYAVNDSRQLCPEDWHVPSASEWHQLVSFVEPEGDFTDILSGSWGNNSAGAKLKEIGTSHWLSPNNDATNLTEFSALPSGFRGADAQYYFIGRFVRFYTSTESENEKTRAWFVELNNQGPGVWHYYFHKNNAHSVRCIQD